MEATHVQEFVEVEAKRAQDKAESDAKLAETTATMEKIMGFLKLQQQTSTPSTSGAEKSTYFFNSTLCTVQKNQTEHLEGAMGNYRNPLKNA